MKKNILIISPFFSPNLGGVESYLDGLTSELLRLEYRVLVLTYQPLTTKTIGLGLEKRKNLEIRRIKWFGYNWFNKFENIALLNFFYLTPGLLFHTLLFMVKNGRKIDLVHAHGLTAAFVARIVGIFFPKKKVFSIHAVYHFAKKKLLAKAVYWLLKDFDEIIALAKYSKIDLMGIGLHSAQIKVIYQWVDQKIFKPKDKIKNRKKLKLKGGAIILFAGRLIKEKGVYLLLAIAGKLPEINFIIVGDGEEKNNLEDKTRKSRNIILAGRKNPGELAEYYGACDLLIQPSLYDEGFSRVVLEAMSCGRPVVASQKGCLPEMIPSSCGVLLKPSAGNFYKAIEKLFANKAVLIKMGDKAVNYAKKNYSRRNITKLIEVYNNG